MDHVAIVGSSHIRSAGFDPDRGELEITFRNGATYRYRGVHESVWLGLMATHDHGGSVGQYVARAIKGVHSHVKLA